MHVLEVSVNMQGAFLEVFAWIWGWCLFAIWLEAARLLGLRDILGSPDKLGCRVT